MDWQESFNENRFSNLIFCPFSDNLYRALFNEQKTPLPEGCENLKADCEGCKDYACTNNPAHNSRKD